MTEPTWGATNWTLSEWAAQAAAEARGAAHLCGGPNCTAECGPDNGEGYEFYEEGDGAESERNMKLCQAQQPTPMYGKRAWTPYGKVSRTPRLAPTLR